MEIKADILLFAPLFWRFPCPAPRAAAPLALLILAAALHAWAEVVHGVAPSVKLSPGVDFLP